MPFFCPKCWKDFEEDLTRCPYCHLNIAEFLKDKDYAEKLIIVLNHPEPETPIRAAWILGKLQDKRAVQPLIKLIGTTKDVYIARAAVEALGRIDTAQARKNLKIVAETHPAVLVKDAADRALAAGSGTSDRRNRRHLHPIKLEVIGGNVRTFTDLALDYTGTLALDGVLLPGVAERLTKIAGRMHITILTADTFGKAEEELKRLPVDLLLIGTGLDKAKAVLKMSAEKVIAIGNGRNDVAMMKQAGLRIAVIGPEGAPAELLQIAEVVVGNICDALDLIIHPMRLKATLRD